MYIKQLLRWVPVGILMGIIFYLSHQPASISRELSSGITMQVIEFVAPLTPLDAGELHHQIRKSAHFFAYFILGFFILNAFRKVTVKNATITLLICIIFAISDELHQLYIPGRSGEVRDVFIDGAGALTGIGTYYIITSIFRAFKKSRRSG